MGALLIDRFVDGLISALYSSGKKLITAIQPVWCQTKKTVHDITTWEYNIYEHKKLHSSCSKRDRKEKNNNREEKNTGKIQA